MNCNLSLIFSKQASEDLDNIFDYIVSQFSAINTATNFYNKIFKEINNLTIFPEAHPLAQNAFFINKNVRKLIVDNYIVFYKPNYENNRLEIIRILYAKRNLNLIDY